MDFVTFTKEQLDQAISFSKQVNTSFYSSRNQNDIVKRQIDAKIGKLGEIVVYALLKDVVENLTYPDLKIYDSIEKSWDYDLKGKGVDIHVKSQNVEIAKQFGTSWVFQKSDTHIFKEYLEQDEVAFVTVDLVKNIGVLKAIVPLYFLHQNDLFKPLKLKHLSSKLAVYWEDLEKIIK